MSHTFIYGLFVHTDDACFCCHGLKTVRAPISLSHTYSRCCFFKKWAAKIDLTCILNVNTWSYLNCFKHSINDIRIKIKIRKVPQSMWVVFFCIQITYVSIKTSHHDQLLTLFWSRKLFTSIGLSCITQFITTTMKHNIKGHLSL